MERTADPQPHRSADLRRADQPGAARPRRTGLRTATAARLGHPPPTPRARRTRPGLHRARLHPTTGHVRRPPPALTRRRRPDRRRKPRPALPQTPRPVAPGQAPAPPPRRPLAPRLAHRTATSPARRPAGRRTMTVDAGAMPAPAASTSATGTCPTATCGRDASVIEAGSRRRFGSSRTGARVC
ncbi:MAG: hypothetical protein AVDCRST_MAG16-2480 [uncultured Frankineae bacterium]|uniref:Uncharacterized protein n=1 Tax=uncultured Frankineae bacterium TaxID=437475 RepID=A0A6J4M9A2_9ACTN|nr:MAG: hypothetical protein AVDCRST_MAG16-2480 [uncultured Frankineae bacterium]